MAIPFNQESWIWYTCAMLMIAARLISRKLLFRSWKDLQYDDWIMGVFVTASYTVLTVMANKWLKYKSNLEPPEFDFSVLNAQELDRRRSGSIFMVVVEQMQIAVIWSCKACLLIMYHRLTRTALRYENIAIKILSAYVGLSFVVLEILYAAAWCRPFPAYYAVPTSSSQCNTLVHHRITKAVFNISSDLIMLCIALQMLVRSLLPLKRKIILSGIFSLGIFVVAASIINSYSSFTNPYGTTWMSWYVRESSTAILVANLPFTWTILRDLFELGDFDQNNPPPPWTYHSPRTAGGRQTAQYLQRTAGTGSHPSKHISPTNSNSMTLVGSMSTTKPVAAFPNDSPLVEDLDKDDLDEDVQRQDFAPPPVPSADDGIIHIDIEHGLLHPSQPRPVSPDHVQQRIEIISRPATIEEDGTGGFYVNNRPISPPSRIRIVSSTNHSREPSLSSSDRRPMSPMPSQLSSVADSNDCRASVSSAMGKSGGTAGGGRSARDRRARARMSH